MSHEKRGNRLFKILLGSFFFGIFLAGGAYSAYKFAVELPMAIASNGWPTAEATIAVSKLRSGRKKHKKHDLLYAYRVDGRHYENNDVRFMSHVFGDKPRVLHRRYPEGDKIIVHYNPQQPSNSVIETGVHVIGFIGVFLLAALFLTIGFFGLRATYRN